MKATPEAPDDRGANHDRGAGELLEFLTPGLVHGFGNALFAIRGGAEALASPRSARMDDAGAEERFGKIRGVISEGCSRADIWLSVLRALGAPGDLAQSRVGFHEAVDMAVRASRIPVRERGRVLEWQSVDGEEEMFATVDLPIVIRSVVATVAAVVDALPMPGPECVRIRDGAADEGDATATPEWRRLVFEVGAEAGEPALPFRVDAPGIALTLGARLHELVGDAARCEANDTDRLQLSIRAYSE